MLRRAVIGLIALLFCVVAAACGSSENESSTASQAGEDTTASSTPQKTGVAINFTMQPVFAPLEYGRIQGIFERAGFDVEITPTQGSDQAMTLLNTGKVDYALSDFDTYATQAIEGKTQSTAVYVWLDRTSLAIASTEPLSDPESLSGKSFGTTGFSAGRRIIPYVMEANGVDPNSVQVETLDFSVVYPSLFQGDIDTAEVHSPGSWQNLVLTADEQGAQVYLKRLSDWGYDGYEKVLIASEQAMQDPGSVGRFVEATAESLEAAVSSATDDEIFDISSAAQPSAVRSATVADWNDFKDLLDTPGAFDEAKVRESLQRLKAYGAISSVPNPATVYDNQFVQEIEK